MRSFVAVLAMHALWNIQSFYQNSARGRGVGTQLMHRLLAHAKKGGAISMFAGVSAANPAGVAFHAALGFSQVATLEKVGCKFDAAIDLVLMQKFL